MCNVSQDIMNKLSATIQKLLDDGQMFTAYDVTVLTRTREAIQLKHSDVQGACHEIDGLRDALDFGHDQPDGTTVKWYRAQQNVPGTSGAWAWVYYPAGLDANQYQFNSHKSQPKKAQTSPTKTPAPAPSLSFSTVNDGVTSDSGGEQDDGTFAVDYRNRLMIPTRFMREAGLSAGDNCCILCDNISKSIAVFKVDPNLTGIGYTVQKVEKDGEIRLSSKTLNGADLHSSKFVIETTDRTLGTSGNSVKVVQVKKAD